MVSRYLHPTLRFSKWKATKQVLRTTFTRFKHKQSDHRSKRQISLSQILKHHFLFAKYIHPLLILWAIPKTSDNSFLYDVHTSEDVRGGLGVGPMALLPWGG